MSGDLPLQIQWCQNAVKEKNQLPVAVRDSTHDVLPWVPEVSRGTLRDLPAQGRRPTNERQRRKKTSGEERFDLLFSLNFDHSYRITFKPITANISYCDHMHQHVKIRQIRVFNYKRYFNVSNGVKRFPTRSLRCPAVYV